MTPSDVREHYRHALGGRDGLLSRQGGCVGAWAGPKAVPIADLVTALTEPDSANPLDILKQSDRITTSRGPLFGEDAVIKRYALPSLGLRLKYLARPTRARRAWAAAQTLQALQIPTPEALGLLEIKGKDSFYICRFVNEATSMWTWIRCSYPKLSSSQQHQFRQQLAQQVRSLYKQGIYHADLKAANLLIQETGDDTWRFQFIDLDAMQFGVQPSRRQIIRNFVQLNGSLGSRVPDEDRVRFMEEFASDYPWIRDDAVAEQVRSWTRRRLQRELDRTCGP